MVPSAGNPQSLNRYAYALNNPVKYVDPSGHYVCSADNPVWENQTCYDVINLWLNYLKQDGGALGTDLVKKFWASDQEFPIKIHFSQGLGAWGQTDTRFGKLITLQLGDYANANETEQKIYSIMFGHELHHLVNQKNPQVIGSAFGEKEAYDLTWDLMQNMGFDPNTILIDEVKAIHQTDYSDAGLAQVQRIVGASELRPARSGDPVLLYIGLRAWGGRNAVTYALGVSYDAFLYQISGCFDGTCGPPGWHPSWNGWREQP